MEFWLARSAPPHLTFPFPIAGSWPVTLALATLMRLFGKVKISVLLEEQCVDFRFANSATSSSPISFDRYGQEGYLWRRYNSRNCQALLKAKLEIVAPVALC